MKKTIGKLILITVALVSAIALSYEQRNKISSQRNVIPIETIIRQKSGDDEWKEQRERREWIEHMHRAAPGTDWRKIERDNRWAKYRQKLPAIRQRGAKTNLIKITGDTMQGYWVEKGRLGLRFNLKAIRENIGIIGVATTDAVFNKDTLFIRGENSNYISNDYQELINEYFPENKIVTLPNAGHWLHAEQPELFLKETEDFLIGD